MVRKKEKEKKKMPNLRKLRVLRTEPQSKTPGCRTRNRCMIDSATKTAGIQKKKKKITDHALRTPTPVLLRFPGCSDETKKYMYTLEIR